MFFSFSAWVNFVYADTSHDLYFPLEKIPAATVTTFSFNPSTVNFEVGTTKSITASREIYSPSCVFSKDGVAHSSVGTDGTTILSCLATADNSKAEVAITVKKPVTTQPSPGTQPAPLPDTQPVTQPKQCPESCLAGSTTSALQVCNDGAYFRVKNSAGGDCWCRSNDTTNPWIKPTDQEATNKLICPKTSSPTGDTGIKTSAPVCPAGQTVNETACIAQGNGGTNQAPKCENGVCSENSNPTDQASCDAQGGTWKADKSECSTSWGDKPAIVGPGTNRDMVAQGVGAVVGPTAGVIGNFIANSTPQVVKDVFSGATGTVLAKVLDGTGVASLVGKIGGTVNGSIVNFGGTVNAAKVSIGSMNPDTVGGVNVDFSGMAGAGIASFAVTLLMGGSVKDAVKAGIKSAAISVIANTAAPILISSLGANGLLLGMGPVGWAIAIGLILSMLLCPVLVVELPNGVLTAPSTFLVGKINKKMKGDSWEKLPLTDEQMEVLNRGCGRDSLNSLKSLKSQGEKDSVVESQSIKCAEHKDKFPFKRDEVHGFIVEDTAKVDETKCTPLAIIIGEILPEILHLDSLKIFDLQYQAKEAGEWFMDQNGMPQYFSQKRTQKSELRTQNLDGEMPPIPWGNINNRQINADRGGAEGNRTPSEQVAILSSMPMAAPHKRSATENVQTKNENVNILVGDSHHTGNEAKGLPPYGEIISKSNQQSQELSITPIQIDRNSFEFSVTKPQNAQLKLLFEGGIQEAYHAKKLNMLARFRPVLTWFYALTDNTALGNIVKHEILAKEGFTLEEKVGDEWKVVQQWVTYPDQKRAITVGVRSQESGVGKNTDSPSCLLTPSSCLLENSLLLHFRVRYEGDYLKLTNVSASVEENPQYTITALKDENLLPSLKSTDDIDEEINTGIYYKFTFDLPHLDSADIKRELFIQTNGYYHPLTDKQGLEEMQKNYKTVEGWLKKIGV